MTAAHGETVGYNIRADERHRVQLECRFFGPFREDVGEETVRVDLDAGTVGDLLRTLEADYPVLEGRLIDDEGAGLAGKTVVTKNRTDVRHVDGLDTPLEADDTYRLVPSVYGG